MIYTLKNQETCTISQVGGKGRALMEMTLADLPVPDAIILSTKFFEPWLEHMKLTDAFVTVLNDATKEACDMLVQTAEELRFTKDQKEAIDQHMIEGQLFAVRSSSPEEDLEGTSFAGMYETFLGTRKEALEATVAKAFASCFDYRVLAYKQRNQKDLKDTSIAVVVQRQLDSRISGVGFSINPMNNCYDEVMINASYGLGEAIVSGIVTPDMYVVDSVKNIITEKRLGDKKTVLILDKNGGYTQKDMTADKICVMLDSEILELSRMIKQVESYYKHPVDIEWAYEDDILFLLQARPVTTHIPMFEELMTEPGAPKNLYVDNIQMSQGFSEPMSVLGLELWAMIFETVKLTMTHDLDGTAPAIHGKHYINHSYFRMAMGKKSADQMMGDFDRNVRRIIDTLDFDNEFTPKSTPQSVKGIKSNMIRRGLKSVPGILGALWFDYDKVVQKYLATAENIIRTINQSAKEDDFKKLIKTTMKSFEDVTKTAGFVAVAVFTMNRIRALFEGMDIEKEVSAMAMDLKGNPTSEMGKLMYDLACNQKFQSIENSQAFDEALDTGAFGDAFMKNYNHYMEAYSMRGICEIDIATKRTYEERDTLFTTLKEINISDNHYGQVKDKRLEAYNNLLEKAKKIGKEKQFVKLSQKYQSIMGYREHPKYVVVQVLDILRRKCLEIGENFVNQGRLNDINQIFSLHVDDIDAAMNNMQLDIRKIVQMNLEPYKLRAHINQWPLVMDSRGKIYKPVMEVVDGDIIGEAIAPGIVRGRAKVLKTPYEKPLNPGEILVTTATEPAWTPVFMNAAGVVMEIGGPLQHGGIIAREYGIPCVSGLMGVMDIIQDGDLLEVNGNDGFVRVVERSGDE